jgi:phage portal protein BeeE
VTSLFRSLARANPPISLNDLLQSFQFGGLNYPLQMGGTPGQKGEEIQSSFQGYVQGAYQRNGVVFACMAARAMLFSEARFQFRQMRFGRPGDLFGTGELGVLENPWPGGTTGDLLGKAITDVDLAGNFYAIRRGREITRLRPDWVTIVLGSRTGSELDTQVVGYEYKPGGPSSGEDPILLLPEQVAHFAPIPDPLAKYRGMSWLTPILNEIAADESASTHKRLFFENGAKLGYVVTLGEGSDASQNPDKFERWVAKFKAGHEGAANAYRTLFLAGGADVKTVGADMQQVDFASVQGHGETRVCAAARVPPIIVGLSEGLESATYSNYGQARRAFADLTMRPLWRNVAGSLARLVNVPASAELWYDSRDIPFLQEDQKDAAAIQQTKAVTIRELINAGYEPETVVKAVEADDYGLLKHTGLVSVQLQEPGAQIVPSKNGNGQPTLPAPTS